MSVIFLIERQISNAILFISICFQACPCYDHRCWKEWPHLSGECKIVQSPIFSICCLLTTWYNPHLVPATALLIDDSDRTDIWKHGHQHGFHGGHERVQDGPDHALLHEPGTEGDYESIRSRLNPHWSYQGNGWDREEGLRASGFHSKRFHAATVLKPCQHSGNMYSCISHLLSSRLPISQTCFLLNIVVIQWREDETMSNSQLEKTGALWDHRSWDMGGYKRTSGYICDGNRQRRHGFWCWAIPEVAKSECQG